MVATVGEHVGTRAVVDDVLLARIRAEFLEMPGLCLTTCQARRLWALEPCACECVLAKLMAAGFVRRTRDGRFVRADMA
jgi:hypothetical protein